ncbi:MAG: HlyD family efflux transporter periplasmic adaptor subunit, partial [Deltaproteobacteria bacterium]|nr:HlyD family efflux transporter periplasmic adaptor subunit [Deltaproteobacteria bacterium]
MTNSLYKSAIKLAIRNGKYILLGIAILFFLFWLRLNPILVEQYTVKYEDIVSEVMGTGTLEAHVETVISSKISGLLTHVNVDQGDSIKNSQVLARLDDRELIQQVEIAKADLEAAKATVTRAQADVNRARAVCEQARRDNVRNQELFRKGTISESEDEKSTEALKIAEAELAREKAAAAEAEKQLIVAKNTLEYHRARLADTVINAPFDGLIIRRDREPGDVVVPGSSIFLLISTKEMWIKAWVDETQIGKLSPRQKARIIFRSEPDDTYQGGIVRIGRESDRETRELLVDVLIDKLPS